MAFKKCVFWNNQGIEINSDFNHLKKDQIMTKSTSPSSKNYHTITFDKDPQTIAITWKRNPKEVERIFNNLHFFKITPSKKLMTQIEKITLKKTSKEVTDIFSI
jgi:hypothetical protein